MRPIRSLTGPTLVWDAERKVRREAGLYWVDEIKNLADARAEAWDEGWRNGVSGHPDQGRITDNPYRSAT